MQRTTYLDFQEQPQAVAQVLDHTFGTGAKALAAARAAIASPREILITGMGASYFSALVFADAMAKAGKPVLAIETGELLHGPVSLCAGKTVILISRSGESVEIVKLLDRIADLDCVTIGLSNIATSTLGRRAQLPLWMNSPRDMIVAQQSYLATVAVLLALVGALAPQYRSAADFAPVVPALRATVAMLPDATLAIGPALAEHRPLYIFGRQSGYATALEAQLLIHEVAQFPSVAMTGHGFRHGPFEVVDSGFTAILITRDGPLRRFDEALARDIRAKGGRAFLSGPGGDLPHAPIVEALAPLVAILPLQMAAIRLAEARGMVPGKFRWSGLVTTSEDALPNWHHQQGE
jgi:glutamine---fructose-6-phosphate transaminase (isomerizing)